MDVAAAAQVLLAVVLLVSGLAKAVDPTGTRTAAEGLGVPVRLVAATAVLLPLAEVAAALLLVLAPVAGLLLALVLLTAFTGAVAVALAQGRRPTCRCFGRLGGGEVSGRTLARNGLLLLVALGSLLLGGAAVAPVPAAVGALLGVGLLALEVLDGRRVQAAGLEQRVPAPGFRAPLLDGGDTTLDGLLASGRPLLLVVLSPGCGGCTSLVPRVRRWARDHGDVLTLAVLGLTTPGLVRDLVGDLPVPVLLDADGSVRRSLGVEGTPGGVLVDPEGLQRGVPAVGAPAVERLLEAALAAGWRGPSSPAPADVVVPVRRDLHGGGDASP